METKSMHSYSNYLKYLIKGNIIKYIVLVMFAMVSVYEVAHIFPVMDTSNQYLRLDYSSIVFPAFLAVHIIAFLELNKFFNKRNLDSWFSLPISRTKILSAHITNAVIQVLLFVGTQFIGTIISITNECGREDASFSDMVDIGSLGLCFFALLIALLLSCLFAMFVVNIANNAFDAFVFTIAYTVLPMIFVELLIAPLNSILDDRTFGAISGVIYSPTIFADGFVSDLFKKMSNEDYVYYSLYISDSKLPPLWATLLMLVIFAVSGILLFKMFNRKKAYEAEGPSLSIFGYRTLIPILIFTETVGPIYSMIEYQGFFQEFLVMIVALLFMLPRFYVYYIIFRRTWRIKKVDILSALGAILAAGLYALLLSLVA